MKSFELQKYLRKHPAPLTLPVSNAPLCGVVIPACNELEEIGATLASLQTAAAHSPLAPVIIVVINYPHGADPGESLELKRRFELNRYPGVIPLWLPELCGGVGAARKAGMDSLIAAIPPEHLEQSAIFSLDADTQVSTEYFKSVLPLIQRCGTVSIGFRHRPAATPAGQMAIDHYERYLKRYVDKLRTAGSPYAFYTIGSAFGVRGDIYVKCGGMKIREAGEDFYFLQSAAKISGVCQLETPLVFPSPRPSARVPFGTGPAVAAIMAGKAPEAIPDSAFEKLARLLAAAADDEKLKNIRLLQESICEKSSTFLAREKFFERWPGILKNLPDTPEKRRRAFHEWFDGLKTLRFLHFFT